LSLHDALPIWTRILEMDRPHGVRVLIRDHHVLIRLEDLERMRHVGRPRDAGHEALHLGIELELARLVLPLPLEGPRLVRDLVAFDDADPRRHGPARAERIERAGPRRVRTDVPVRRLERLPDAV